MGYGIFNHINILTVFVYSFTSDFDGFLMQNLLIVRDADTPNHFGGIGYLGFEKLTFVPIQVNKIVIVYENYTDD